jgi:hypothetical protein
LTIFSSGSKLLSHPSLPLGTPRNTLEGEEAMTTTQASRSAKRTLARLTPPLDKQLLAYVTAATAAGVGLLAQPAEAKIVYTVANTTIKANGGSVNLDLNNDGIADFIIDNSFVDGVRHPEGFFASALTIYPVQAANEIWGVLSAKGWECAAALPPAVKVGPGAAFQPKYLPLWEASGSYTRGATEHCPWASKHRGAFLGLKFVVKGQTHYGWAHITVGSTTVLNAYAYETVPNQPILTGKISGPVAETQASLLSVPNPQPASLGLLARGAEGLAIWRRTEEALRFKEESFA